MLKPMRRAAIVAVICLAGSTVARAQEVPGVPTGVVLSEVMMDVQGTEAQLYGTLLGSSVLPQTLSGTSSTDLSTSSFTFSLNPGSTDLGQAISDTVSGQFNPNDGSYDWTSTGSWGTTVAWQENGNIQAISKDIIVPNWTLKSQSATLSTLSNPPKLIYTVTDEVDISGPGEATPAFSTKTSFKATGPKRSFGTDTYDPKTGKYKYQDAWKRPPVLPPGFQFASFLDVSSGVNPLAGGQGTYTTTISSVPEPSSLAHVWGEEAGAGWSCAPKRLFFQALHRL